MVYKLHGIDMSTCTQRVQLIANEIGLSSPDQLETIWVDYKNGKHKSEEFLEINPFGQVPGFEDTEAGLVFHESRAISRYLATKHKSTLIPLPSAFAIGSEYLAALARFETAASIESTIWDPLVTRLNTEIIFKPMLGHGEPDQAEIDKLLKELNTKFDAYESILGKQAYLGGTEMSLADLFHIPSGKLLFVAGQGDLITSRPALAGWWKSIVSRPSVERVQWPLEGK